MPRRDLTEWNRGVADAIARLEREAERYSNTNVPYSHAMQEAADLLSKLRPSRRS